MPGTVWSKPETATVSFILRGVQSEPTRWQSQAISQIRFSPLLPQIFLSGFMFPFKGMAVWAQWIGEVFPTTHAKRIVRGLLLTGNGASDILPEMWPLVLFTLAALVIATWLYRETLD
jgi:ABC-2 type transport system permease protein